MYLKDGAKNISDAEKDKITLDTVAPSCRLWDESTTWTNGNRTIRYGCNDDGSGCKQVEKGNQLFQTTAKTGIIKNYTIEDNAGNVNNCNGISANVYVDKTAPSCGNLSITSATTNGLNGNVSCLENTNESGCESSSSTFSNLASSSSEVIIKDIVGNSTNCTIDISGKTVEYCSNDYTLSNSKCVYTADATEVSGCPSGYTENPNSSGNTRCYKDVGEPSYSYSCSFSFASNLRWKEPNIINGTNYGGYQCWYYNWNVTNETYNCSSRNDRWLFNEWTYHSNNPTQRKNCVFLAIEIPYCSSGSESGGRCYEYSAKTATTYECSKGTYDSSIEKCIVTEDPSYKCPDNYTEYNDSGYCYKKGWE